MFDWYTRYYSAVQLSRANAIFNERLAGRDLCQHDFIELEQLDQLVEWTGLRAGQQALDLGCGNGFIAEYLSDLRRTSWPTTRSTIRMPITSMPGARRTWRRS
jgi:hypothetical protein